MTITRGTRTGPYEILAPLGAGGMGEVYRARDTRLQRDVAIKALPPEFADNPERLARFQREARLLASLNHPNVAAIYGLEEADGAKYLVLEIVEGESLAQRLASGPMPVEEALAVCAQIASGVSAAHDAGVIHRDLKPGNVMVRPDGSVKVLDFGLAKGSESPSASSDLSASPTVSVGTQTGVILGTAAYMSPEQARGRVLDRRTDIWSFGCILYECLTGRQAFREDTVSDTLASIIRGDPDWRLLPPETPARIRDLVRRCLQKDPKRRLHDIADARLELEEALAAPPETATPAPAQTPASGKGTPLLWIGLGLAAGALLGAILTRALSSRRRPETRATQRSTISLPAETSLRVSTVRPSMAISGDGRKLVFRATRGGVDQLYLRDLGRADAVPISGTRGAYNPFFSPDGEWLAFFAGGELKKIALSGGAPALLAETTPVTQGGTWKDDGTIIFAPRPNGGLARLAPGAKTYEFFANPDRSKGEKALIYPQLLPGGEDVLVIVRAGRDFDDLAASNAVVLSLKTGTRRVLVEGAAFARYVPGYLVFTKGTSVLAAPCDPRTWKLTGPAAPILRDVLTSPFDAAPYLGVSDNGLLVYASGGMVPIAPDTLLWIDRSGKEELIPLPPSRFSGPRLSPDGKRLAVTIIPIDSSHSSVSIYDFSRGVLSTLTPEPGRHFASSWSADGRRIAFATFEEGNPRLSWKAVDGSGGLEFLSPGGFPEFPTSWSSDGRTLLYTAAMSGSLENMDLWYLSLSEGKAERRSWLAEPSREIAGFFSPDGRTVAYVSDESGKNEVYVRPFPGPGGKIKVSTNGGAEPAWASLGREIFYRTLDTLMSAPVETQPELSVGIPRAVLTDRYDRWGREDVSRNYDVSPDGTRFLVIKSQELKIEPVTQLNLLSNWPAELAGPDTAGK